MSTPPPVTICDEEGCHVLIPATLEDRREHRRGHNHDRKVVEALRTALKDANAKIGELTRRLAGLETDVAHIEIPEQIEPLAIVHADDLDPLDDEDEDDYQTVSTYTDDDDTEPTTARADAIAAFTTPTDPDYSGRLA